MFGPEPFDARQQFAMRPFAGAQFACPIQRNDAAVLADIGEHQARFIALRQTRRAEQEIALRTILKSTSSGKRTACSNSIFAQNMLKLRTTQAIVELRALNATIPP
jgi:hypothetical protein